MRDELVMPATARRLGHEGLVWEPRTGDWCTVLGAAHIGEGSPGLWLVVAVAPGGQLSLIDSEAQWPIAQVPARECLWLPTTGQLKTWLRAGGYTLSTGETASRLLGSSVPRTRHVCRAANTVMGASGRVVEADGLSEAEAVAGVVLQILGVRGEQPPPRFPSLP